MDHLMDMVVEKEHLDLDFLTFLRICKSPPILFCPSSAFGALPWPSSSSTNKAYFVVERSGQFLVGLLEDLWHASPVLLLLTHPWSLTLEQEPLHHSDHLTSVFYSWCLTRISHNNFNLLFDTAWIEGFHNYVFLSGGSLDFLCPVKRIFQPKPPTPIPPSGMYTFHYKHTYVCYTFK